MADYIPPATQESKPISFGFVLLVGLAAVMLYSISQKGPENDFEKFWYGEDYENKDRKRDWEDGDPEEE